MDLGLTGKNAIVTGASAGIGRAIAERLAEEGANVTLVARRLETLQDAADEIIRRTGRHVSILAADMSDPVQIAEVVHRATESSQQIDVLVNSIPAPVIGTFMEHSDHEWEEAMRIKFFAYVRMTREVVPFMTGADGGVVVNIIGLGGKAPFAGHLAGGAANAALMLLTTGLAKELGPRRVRVVGVNPGATLTTRFEGILDYLAEANDRTVAEVYQEQADAIPTGSIPRPEDVADLVAFLASGRARQINGTTVPLDGGALQTV